MMDRIPQLAIEIIRQILLLLSINEKKFVFLMDDRHKYNNNRNYEHYKAIIRFVN